MTQITVNADAGESLGPHPFGRDLGSMDDVVCVDFVCAGQAGDPGTMAETVAQAISRGIAVGAHPGVPVLGTAHSGIPGAPQMASAVRRVSSRFLPSSSKEQYP